MELGLAAATAYRSSIWTLIIKRDLGSRDIVDSRVVGYRYYSIVCTLSDQLINK
jgi:hypothetical protein